MNCLWVLCTGNEGAAVKRCPIITDRHRPTSETVCAQRHLVYLHPQLKPLTLTRVIILLAVVSGSPFDLRTISQLRNPLPSMRWLHSRSSERAGQQTLFRLEVPVVVFGMQLHGFRLPAAHSMCGLLMICWGCTCGVWCGFPLMARVAVIYALAQAVHGVTRESTARECSFQAEMGAANLVKGLCNGVCDARAVPTPLSPRILHSVVSIAVRRLRQRVVIQFENPQCSVLAMCFHMCGRASPTPEVTEHGLYNFLWLLPMRAGLPL
jgi:hypothetical protein